MNSAGGHQCLRHTWPALEEVALSGWIARLSMGGFNRSNSVLPAQFDAGRAIEEAIGEVETLYRSRGLKPTFQIIDGTAPEGLDVALARRGYESITPSHVMAKRVTGRPAVPDIALSDAAGPEWLSLYLATQSPVRAAECREILARLPEQHAFFVAQREGEAAGTGLAAIHDGCAGIDCILTRPDMRRRGVSRDILAAIEAWAAAEGATWLVLAVVADNLPAVTLYGDIGFERIGGYLYRVLD